MSDQLPLKSAGAFLKEMRESKNISQEEAAKATHIHLSVLKNLEADDYSAISPVYARGFLRLYAEYLGVSKDEVMERFQDVSQTQKKSRVIIPSAPKEASGPVGPNIFSQALTLIKAVDYRVFVILVLVVLVIMGFGKIKKMRSQRPVKARTAVVQAEKPKAVKPAAPAAKKEPAVASAKEKPAAVSVKQTSVTPRERVVLVVRAKAKTWLQVKVDGKTVFQNVLNRGSAESWTADKKIEMTIGNAGSVELELNGRILEKIGRPGQTLKNVTVTREGLSVGK